MQYLGRRPATTWINVPLVARASTHRKHKAAALVTPDSVPTVYVYRLTASGAVELYDDSVMTERTPAVRPSGFDSHYSFYFYTATAGRYAAIARWEVSPHTYTETFCFDVTDAYTGSGGLSSDIVSMHSFEHKGDVYVLYESKAGSLYQRKNPT